MVFYILLVIAGVMGGAGTLSSFTLNASAPVAIKFASRLVRNAGFVALTMLLSYWWGWNGGRHAGDAQLKAATKDLLGAICAHVRLTNEAVRLSEEAKLKEAVAVVPGMPDELRELTLKEANELKKKATELMATAKLNAARVKLIVAEANDLIGDGELDAAVKEWQKTFVVLQPKDAEKKVNQPKKGD